ncbi:hypothetical protein BJX61DRAFT_60641 [Aspergillus egyptiacus]|nr:hypothetical protein BJX61DRAFT_60641 [Aspergillus egyptiacus]
MVIGDHLIGNHAITGASKKGPNLLKQPLPPLPLSLVLWFLFNKNTYTNNNINRIKTTTINQKQSETMQPELSSAPHSPQRPSWKRPAFLRPIRFGRWSLPVIAAIIIGYGISNQGPMKMDSFASYQIAEQERLRKNQQLMDAYGYKDNVDDLQKAMEAYEVRHIAF